MSYSIRQIIEKVANGQIRIPTFQRGFVWEPEMIAYLMDSIYKGYPFGTLLFWRTKEALKSEKSLGPFDLIEKEAGLPLDYVLDGQQRITSIFGVFQSELEPSGDSLPFRVYFDFTLNPDAQDTQFFSLSDEEVDVNRHFPLNSLFDPIKYREATNNLSKELIQTVDTLQTRFKESSIPVQMLETEDRAKVAIVFERINRKSIELDTFQLLNAWTWSEDFELQKAFEELQEELDPFGFAGVGEDVDLILRCASAILARNASARSLIDLNGNVVRGRFQEILNGLRGAIDFLQTNLNVKQLSNLPYSSLIVPLATFFAVEGNRQVVVTDPQRRELIKWFWKSCFSRRFSAGVQRNLNSDIAQAVNLRLGQPQTLPDFNVNITMDFYKIINSKLDLLTLKHTSFS
jgi:Protein of unknown function DUF262